MNQNIVLYKGMVVWVSDAVMTDLSLRSGQAVDEETLHRIIAGNYMSLLKPEPLKCV